MIPVYEYKNINLLTCITEYENIKDISINCIYFQLDYLGFIRGDILMDLIPHHKLLSFINDTQCNLGTNTQLCNMLMEQLKKLPICEDSYKKIMMVKTDDLEIDEYIMVDIKDNVYCGSRLYPSFCFVEKY
jgi:hypothetical protein